MPGPPPRTLAINARFARRRTTGVERYAREVSARLRTGTVLIEPASQPEGLKGHLWEQLILPFRLGSRTLWSPCNSGPLAASRQFVTIHDCAVIDHPEWFSRSFSSLYANLWPRLVKRAEGIITVSNYSKMRLLENFGLDEKKVTVIYNGVDSGFQPGSAEDIDKVRQQFGIPNGPYVLSVCSQEPRKNLGRLLTAWKCVAAKCPKLTLVLAGGGGNVSVFRNEDQREAVTNVLFTGYVKDELLPALYSGAACFVYPSLYEGFGLPVLEALACGAPVVTSDCTSLPEVSGRVAHLVDPMSSSEIAAAILKTVESGPSEERRKAGREHAAKYTWEHCASQTEALLLSLN